MVIGRGHSLDGSDSPGFETWPEACLDSPRRDPVSRVSFANARMPRRSALRGDGRTATHAMSATRRLSAVRFPRAFGALLAVAALLPACWMANRIEEGGSSGVASPRDQALTAITGTIWGECFLGTTPCAAPPDRLEATVVAHLGGGGVVASARSTPMGVYRLLVHSGNYVLSLRDVRTFPAWHARCRPTTVLLRHERKHVDLYCAIRPG
jgi:hypothetical protein